MKGMPVVIDGRLCNSHLWTTIGLTYRLPDSFVVGFDYSVTPIRALGGTVNDYILLQIGEKFKISIGGDKLIFLLYDGKNGHL